jgi:Ion channel
MLGTESAPSNDPRELSETLPVVVEADFAPIPETDANELAHHEVPDPHHEESLRAQEAFELAAQAALQGDEDLAVRHYLKASNLAEAAREWYLAAVSCQRVGDFLQTEKPPMDLERAFRMYRRAVASYEQCGLFDEARKLSYRLMSLKLKRAEHLKLSSWTRLELFVYWATAGFGYRPLRVLGSALAAVLLYSLIYWFSSGVVTSGASPKTASFWECVYFSGITFATVGYGDFLPAPHMRLLALTEGAMGVFTMGFFVVILANRLRH